MRIVSDRMYIQFLEGASHYACNDNVFLNKAFTRQQYDDASRILNKNNIHFLIVTPWVGVWTMAVTMKVFKMDAKKLLLYSFIRITAYAVVVAVLTAIAV